MHHSLLTLALLIASQSLAGSSLPNRPVNQLDLGRYSGQWHEIARLPMFFQRRCLGAVTATYTPNPDGSIRVLNRCHTSNGSRSVEGVARIEPGRPAVFRVRFAPAWLTWLPQAWADYWVVDVDPNYQWAVVGTPGRNHMWILSRSQTMKRALFDRLRQRERQRGYPVEDLKMMAPLD